MRRSHCKISLGICGYLTLYLQKIMDMYFLREFLFERDVQRSVKPFLYVLTLLMKNNNLRTGADKGNPTV